MKYFIFEIKEKLYIISSTNFEKAVKNTKGEFVAMFVNNEDALYYYEHRRLDKQICNEF